MPYRQNSDIRGLRLRRAVGNALTRDGLCVYFQPIVSAATGRIIAAEALCRLTDPKWGVIPPASFIPAAEQAGLIARVDDRVRALVWEFLRCYDIRRAGLDHISVNLSAAECARRDLFCTIEKEARASGAERGTLHLEITETAAVASRAALARQMERMRRLGFCFHLDDYGTGYAGMTNLLSLPFGVVKLDKSLLDLAENTDKGRMVEGLIAPLHDCRLQVVCEGVETVRQAERLRLWGADYLQGYLYSKPLPAADFAALAGIPRRKACGEI